MNDVLLCVRDLVKTFPMGAGPALRAVNRVSFGIAPGESLGLVGESGSGKSTIGNLITRLTSVSAGQIVFDGEDITHLSQRAMRRLRGAIQIVFQDPWGAQNPRMTIARSLEEPLLLHTRLNRDERARSVRALAERVHLPSASLARYPHELSGGQLQRVAIARAIATRPRLLVLDEPTSSLDLSVRAGILQLLGEIRRETGVATLLISHDLETVELMTDRLLVLYLGSIVEQGRTGDVFAAPVHPYTQTLLSATLPADPEVPLRRHASFGEIPSPIDLPPGCPFAPRCPLAIDACRVEAPALLPTSGPDAGAQAATDTAPDERHVAACVRVADGSSVLSHAAAGT
ncbi:MAG: oligopeptide/dipeptide ABC transporter ATP-binding protein [Lautropia sp.]